MPGVIYHGGQTMFDYWRVMVDPVIYGDLMGIQWDINNN
jgi:hypothetical protein